MVGTLFEHGKFSATDTLQTSYVLMGYGIGLPAYVASKIFMTAFWAHEDTMTPVKISLITATSNVMISLLLIGLIGVAGIALATGLVGWLQVYLLHRQLKGKDSLEFDERLRTVFPKIAICSCLMALTLSIFVLCITTLFHHGFANQNFGTLGPLRGRRDDLCRDNTRHRRFKNS